MIRVLHLSVIMFLHLSAASDAGLNVAPADFDTSCGLHASDYRSSEKVVLDTQYYASQSLIDVSGNSGKWLSLDFDNIAGTSHMKWSDQSQTFTCQHNMAVCGYKDGLQNNWMVTQYINISQTGVTELILNVTFFGPSGSDCVGACSESLGIRTYTTNAIDEEGRNDQESYSDNLATLIHTQGGISQEFASLQIPINSSYTGLYLAIVDPPPGSCVGITRISLFFHVCPEQELNLVRYPEVVAPTSMHIDDIAVPAVCSENAILTSLIDSVECKYQGRWDSNSVVCECIEGYAFNSSSASCEACFPGYYKAGTGNSISCSPCPENSHAEYPASTECPCEKGYYRTSSETASDLCSAPPGPPLDLVSTEITFSRATLSWHQPSQLGGRTDIAYTVAYNGVVITDVTSTQYILLDLLPDTEYTVSVTAMNGISNQLTSPVASMAMTSFTTLPVPAGFVPSKPVNVALVIEWEEPATVYGTVVTYQLLVANSNDSSQATVYNTTHTSYNLTRLNLRPGTYYLWSRTVTTTGTGELSNLISYSTGAEAESVTGPGWTPMVLGVAMGVFVIATVAMLVVIGICYCKKRKWSCSAKQSQSNMYQINSISHHEML